MSPRKSVIALLFALGSASALAQSPASPTPVPSKPVDSATFGPVLNPQSGTQPPVTTQQPSPATTQATGEARPQAQEERAGQPPTTPNRHNEVDPSARPAPVAQPPQQQQQQPEARPERQQRQPAKKDKQAQRRAVEQRIEGTPRIAAPAPQAPDRAAAPVATPPVAPSSTQLVGCAGSSCTDTAGTTYNIPTTSNTGVSSNGRLCTRSGATMQCL
ncbi:hypothetical protein [Massilia consociata]|uniref:Uncharacterized protein n=1 Tax=Massilia consociata TaxID=760117 RepID=A0ABV6FBC5_9BURK